MKKMIYLFILVFSLSTLVACSDDEGTPVFTEPTEFVLMFLNTHRASMI